MNNEIEKELGKIPQPEKRMIQIYVEKIEVLYSNESVLYNFDTFIQYQIDHAHWKGYYVFEYDTGPICNSSPIDDYSGMVLTLFVGKMPKPKLKNFEG